MKQYDKNNDGLDTNDVPKDVWSTLFAKYDTNNNGRLDPAELSALVEEWKNWVEEDPVDEPGQADARKRRVLKIRKIGSR